MGIDFNLNMRAALVLCVLCGIAATALSDRVGDVDVTSLEEQRQLPHSGRFLNSIFENFPVCCDIFARPQCARDCAGQPCGSSCDSRCGLFRVCASVTCSEVASSTCVS